ncbi:MAG TPA: glycosyltransferase family 4 protein [Clostridiaceae bacterium]|jgi:1,2-diacylglycerol 3-alpha-glucosyltransferase|nr:glycosyltransferase family 4 protein [Clostridiaceae bacterium]
MRIGLFTDAFLPQISGVATSTALLQQALKDLGHMVFVITPRDPDQPEQEIDVFRVPSLPFISAKRVSLGIQPALAKQLKALQLDIVHSQTEFGMGAFARQISDLLGVPHVHTFHTLYEDWLNDQIKSKEGGIYQRLTGWYVQKETRNFCNKADRVIVPTKKAKTVLLKYGVTTPLEIIPTGINLQAFRDARYDADGAQAVRRSLGISANDKVLVYVGRISREKHIHELLAYLKRIMPTRRNLHFILVGDGPAKAELMKEAATDDICHFVHFTGPVPWQNVPRYYAAADIFLSASQSETQGLTYIEALAAGVPLLVREDLALEDVVNDGVNGFTFVDETSFAAHLDDLLSLDADAYQSLSAAAYQSSEQYNVDHFAKAVFRVYGDLTSPVTAHGEDVRNLKRTAEKHRI